MAAERTPNRLVREKSPYLLQHAHNPVDWFPWGEEAFAAARTRDVPVFLSIGYSTCHWCHVMERESFENGAIASLLNENFVCIKVDREERPDIDRIYMTALQAIGQNGGWPMSMFLTPDRQPFYGGTYFPPESRFGRAGFPDVLRKIRSLWAIDRANVNESARSIIEFLRDAASAAGPGEIPGTEVIDAAWNQISSTYDPVHGGFGGGPKFPRPVIFDFLLRYHARTGADAPLAMVTHTLRAMAAGGIYDQIGGGFHRYSVDGEWRVPHFEKMLYDQAQLVHAYVGAWLCTREPVFSAVARETLEYVLRDMTDTEGGFYSAEDADSPRPENPEESGEGAFYVWTRKEIAGALKEDASLFARCFGVDESGNAPFDPQHEFTGRNILYVRAAPESLAVSSGMKADEVRTRLDAARAKLHTLRATRPRPLRDDKILTSWNGLMIGAFARGSAAFGEGRYLAAATRAAEFVLAHLRQNGALLRRYRQGESRIEAHLDDYAFFVAGLIDLFESSGEGRWLEHAVELTEEQIRIFHDALGQGFFDTSGNDATVLVRMKEQYDGAEPAGNSVAAMNLIRLSRIIDRPEWETLASDTIAGFGVTLRAHPGVLPLMAAALDYHLTAPRQVVIAGAPGDPRTREMSGILAARYLPTTVTILLDPGPDGDGPRTLNPFFRTLNPTGGEPAAYVCRNFVCDLPVRTADSLAALIDGEKRAPV
jgi:uncharacterized protein YyaL (SSP411 family)